MDIKIAAAAQAYARSLNRTVEGGPLPGSPASRPEGPSFGEMMRSAATQSVDAGKQAETMSLQSLNKNAQLTDIVTAVTNAEVTLDTVVAVRDRVISAYQDILKMPI